MPRRDTPPTDATPVAELWNLSETTSTWLNDLGVHTYGDLSQRDLYELWGELKAAHKQVTKLMLLALWGAVHNCHWNQVPPEAVADFEASRHSD